MNIQITDKRNSSSYEKKAISKPGAVGSRRYISVLNNTIFSEYIKSAELELKEQGGGVVYIYRTIKNRDIAMTKGLFVAHEGVFDGIPVRNKIIYAALYNDEQGLSLEIYRGFLEAEYDKMYGVSRIHENH